jgi:hypothetical protein
MRCAAAEALGDLRDIAKPDRADEDAGSSSGALDNRPLI